MAETKKCSKCGQVKSIEDYNKNTKRKDGLDTFCRECHRAYCKAYYAADRGGIKEKIRENTRKARIAAHTAFGEYLKTVQCKDCGNTDSRVIEFDHLPQFEKVTEVGHLIGDRYPWETIKAEIDKCDPVCANCHRIRTFERANSYRHRHHQDGL